MLQSGKKELWIQNGASPAELLGLNVFIQPQEIRSRFWHLRVALAGSGASRSLSFQLADNPHAQVTVGPYEAYDADMDRWDIRRCFLW